MSDNRDIHTDVAVLKTQVSQLKTVLTSVDNAIGKMTEISNNTSKILAVHENKLMNHGESLVTLQQAVNVRDRESEEKIASLHKRIMDMKDQNHEEREKFHKELMTAIDNLSSTIEKEQDAMNTRITALERWKWWVMGIAALAMFLISNLGKIIAVFT